MSDTIQLNTILSAAKLAKGQHLNTAKYVIRTNTHCPSIQLKWKIK